MAARTSIELHRDGCRVVEVVTRPGTGRDVVVRKLVPEAADGSDASTVTDALRRLRRTHHLPRRAWATIWGLRSTQQVLRLPPASAPDLEALAIREATTHIAPLRTGGDGATVIVLPGAEVTVDSQRRREVSVLAVSNADVRDQIQPILDAGFIVEGVATPALALLAMARRRHAGSPNVTAAYVAIAAHASCVAIVRDGLLLSAGEMGWGHAGKNLEAMSSYVAPNLKRFIRCVEQTLGTVVESVVLCADPPDVRTATQPLADALGVRVEALDPLLGVDATAVREPMERFRTQVAALRIAIAVGADPSSLANLLPIAIAATRKRRAGRARVAAAIVLGLLLAAAWLYVELSADRRVHRETFAPDRQQVILRPFPAARPVYAFNGSAAAQEAVPSRRDGDRDPSRPRESRSD